MAGTTTATLAVKVTGDASGASKAFDDVGGGASKFQTGLKTATRFATVAGVGLAAFGTAAFNAASEAEQAAGAVDAVFKGAADTIHSFAETSANDVGLAAGDYEELASKFGAQLKNMGVAADDLAPQTNELVTLGADLAAQYGGSTADAVAALGSLLRGETDPIEKYGVGIKQADIQARKAADGMDGLTGEADKQASLMATLALLTEQTSDAQGAFARESNTAAGQQQRASAAMKDASAELGSALLPLVAKAATAFAKMAGFVKDNSTAFIALGTVIGGLVVAVYAINAAMAIYKASQLAIAAATKAWAAAQWLINAAMTANPIGLIVIGIAALIAAIVVVVKNWDTITAAFQATLDWVKANWEKLLPLLLGPIGLAIVAIVKNFDKIKSVVLAFVDIAKSAFNAVKDVAVAVFNAVKSVITTQINIAKAVVTTAKNVMTSAFRAVKSVALAVFGAIKNFIRSAFDSVRSKVTAVMSAIKGAIRSVRSVVDTLVDLVKVTLAGAFRTAKNVAKGALDALLSPIQWVIDKIDNLIGALGRIKFPSPPGWLSDVGGALGGLIGLSATVPAGRAGFAYTAGNMSRGLGDRRVGRIGSSSNNGGVNITVQGALDPDAVARQIERILLARSRRISGVTRTAGVL